MEEKAVKPSENSSQVAEKKWHCPICGARICLSNKKSIPDQRSTNDANCVLSEKFEMN